MKKAIIIDANSLIYRLYFAAEAMKIKATNIDVKRQTIKMLYSICFHLVWTQDYEYKIACFDSKEKLIRKDQLEAYKSNRKPMPLELVDSLPTIKEVFEQFGFLLLAKPGYEADDLIGSFVKLANMNDIKCDVYTSDKDLLQLINEQTTLHMFVKGISNIKSFNPSSFLEEFGFCSNLIPDFKALAGDSSDNYHGIAGIGTKTASTLLKTYSKGIDDIYLHLDEIKSSIKNKLIAGKNDCYLCKNIATIDQSLFLEQNINFLLALPIKKDELKKSIYSLNFQAFFKYFKNE